MKTILALLLLTVAACAQRTSSINLDPVADGSRVGRIRMAEKPVNGSLYIDLQAVDQITANRVIRFPNKSGTVMVDGSLTDEEHTFTEDQKFAHPAELIFLGADPEGEDPAPVVLTISSAGLSVDGGAAVINPQGEATFKTVSVGTSGPYPVFLSGTSAVFGSLLEVDITGNEISIGGPVQSTSTITANRFETDGTTPLVVISEAAGVLVGANGINPAGALTVESVALNGTTYQWTATGDLNALSLEAVNILATSLLAVGDEGAYGLIGADGAVFPGPLYVGNMAQFQVGTTGHVMTNNLTVNGTCTGCGPTYTSGTGINISGGVIAVNIASTSYPAGGGFCAKGIAAIQISNGSIVGGVCVP